MGLIDLDPNQSAAEQVECLYQTLRHSDEQRVVAYRGGQRYVPGTPAPELASVNGTEKTRHLDRKAILSAPPSERRRLIEEYLRRQLRNVLGLDVSASDVDKPLQAFGLDSLTGIQLRNRIEDHLGLSLSVVDFLRGLSLGQIRDRAAAALSEKPDERPTGPRPPAGLTSENVDQLPEEKLDGLLESLLE